jgi:hypothetical protein
LELMWSNYYCFERTVKGTGNTWQGVGHPEKLGWSSPSCRPCC